jgi:hypothetical protein
MGILKMLGSVPVQIGSWSPALLGATSNPSAVTYSTQVGEYYLVGKLCTFYIRIVTTSITKANATDQIRVSLPLVSDSTANVIARCPAFASNGTPVQNATCGRIVPNVQYVALSQLLNTAAEKSITYEATDPGIGVLTNQITIEINGSYLISGALS